MNKCQWPGCPSAASKDYGGIHCIPHGSKYGKKTVKETSLPIAKKSEKRKREDVILKKMFKQRFEENPACQIKMPGVCTGIAQGFDHKQKTSPSNRLIADNLIMSCGSCNVTKEGAGQKWAKDNGFHTSRFVKIDLTEKDDN